MKDKIILPNKEKIWENYSMEDGEIKYVIATKDERIRDVYILFEKKNEEWEKIKTSSSPEKLQKFIKTREGKQ